MKSLFEKTTLEEIEKRVNSLTPDSQKQWGKMEPDQMLAHCVGTMQVVTGQKKIKRSFLGYMLGPFFKAHYYDDQPAKKDSPTANEFIVKERKDFSLEKETLLKLVRQFHEGGEEQCTKEPHAFLWQTYS